MDDNRLLLVPLSDGLAVEAVAYASGTLCLSIQAGCVTGCPFCASGSRGLQRNLELEEVWQQVAAARAEGFQPQRLTLSGIGEPLHNARVVRTFIAEASRKGLPVSVTTCGAPLFCLETLLDLPHNGVMVSLHAGTPETHRRLVPRGPDFDALWRALASWYSRASRRARRRLGFNVLLLEEINDSPRELTGLTTRLDDFPDATLHLLRHNPVAGTVFRSPPEDVFDQVYAALRARGVNVRRANRWRQQCHGGCGTLYLRHRDAAPHLSLGE